MIPRPSPSTDFGNGIVNHNFEMPKMDVVDGEHHGDGCLNRVKMGVIYCMERFFFWYGRLVADWPITFVLACVLLTTVSGFGLMFFTEESTGTKLWIKEDSSARLNTDWLWEHFPPGFRYNSIILEADDVLTPEVLQTMFRVHKEIAGIETRYGDRWEDMCQKFPVVKPPGLESVLGFRRRKRESEGYEFDAFKGDDDFFDSDFFKSGFDDEETENNVPEDPLAYANYLSSESYPQPYCNIVMDMDKACFETSILELWGDDGEYNSVTEQSLSDITKEDILERLNNQNRSGIFLVDKNFTDMLSGVTYDASGKRIVSAKATVMRWFGRMNGTAALLNPAKNRAEPIDPRMLEFEGDMIKILLNTSHYPQGLKSYPNAMRSFGDVASSTILGDAAKLGIGYTIVFIYVMIMLGRFNCVEQRAFLSMAGIVGVVMGIVFSYGFCSLCGLFFGPMHQTLPFLLLGIGIDDMFVIVQCFKTLSAEERRLRLAERFGKAMQHAGVAITITSITDIVAFGVGGSTVLPALKSFCLYASVGIVATYIFQCTFFVAWMSLDQRRIEAKRDACCCCWTHKNWTPNNFSQKNILETLFQAYGRVITKRPTKAVILVYTLALTGVGIWGNVLLEQRFDLTWFLPPDTYLSRWFAKNKEYFPFGGDRVIVYFHEVDYATSLAEIDALVKTIENQTDIVDDVDAWTSEFIRYTNTYVLGSNNTFPGMELSGETFNKLLTQFMFSPSGGKYRERFHFADPGLRCGEVASALLLSDIRYTHRLFSGPSEHVPAMNRMKRIIADANLTGKVFPLSQGYTFWETDEVIAEELYRNMGLAVLCVFLTTLCLIGNALASIMVLICVVLSLVDVGGFMHFWGLTIDTVSCTMLVIAIGLCVDYSAHIAHRFMVENGTRDERVVHTLTNIGPAVLNGGFTTFLAFILLAGSKSHVFSTFFKIFFLVVVFGLFHGLVLLPVILSIVGPSKPNSVLAIVDYADDDQQGGVADGEECNEVNIPLKSRQGDDL